MKSSCFIPKIEPGSWRSGGWKSKRDESSAIRPRTCIKKVNRDHFDLMLTFRLCKVTCDIHGDDHCLCCSHPWHKCVSGLRRGKVQTQHISCVSMETLQHLTALHIPKSTRAVAARRQDLPQTQKTPQSVQCKTPFRYFTLHWSIPAYLSL